MYFGLDGKGVSNLVLTQFKEKRYLMEKDTNDEFIELAKGRKCWILGVLACTCNGPNIGRQAISDRASQYMLAKFLDLVAHDEFECVSRGESSALRFLGEEEQRLRGDCLHFYANADGIDGEGCFIVDTETAGEGLTELDGAKGGGEGEEVGGVCEVAEGLGVAWKGRRALEGEDGGGGVCGEMGRGGEEGVPGGRDFGTLADNKQAVFVRRRDIQKDG